jgi:hypothetical protein
VEVSRGSIRSAKRRVRVGKILGAAVTRSWKTFQEFGKRTDGPHWPNPFDVRKRPKSRTRKRCRPRGYGCARAGLRADVVEV